MKARWSADDDFIFSAAHGKPRAYSNVRRALASASQVAGLPTVRPHDLRHSNTSNLIAHADLVTVSRAVGHKNPHVTATVYAHALGTPQEQAAPCRAGSCRRGTRVGRCVLCKRLCKSETVALLKTKGPLLRAFLVWAVTGSNRRPPACKAGALPAELTARAFA
jgi:Phage integrase family